MTHIAIPAKQLKNVVAALSELARAKHSHEDFNNIVIGVPANRKHAIYLRATNGDHEAVLYVTATVYQSDETELAVRYKPLHAFLKKAPDDGVVEIKTGKAQAPVAFSYGSTAASVMRGHVPDGGFAASGPSHVMGEGVSAATLRRALLAVAAAGYRHDETFTKEIMELCMVGNSIETAAVDGFRLMTARFDCPFTSIYDAPVSVSIKPHPLWRLIPTGDETAIVVAYTGQPHLEIGVVPPDGNMLGVKMIFRSKVVPRKFPRLNGALTDHDQLIIKVPHLQVMTAIKDAAEKMKKAGGDECTGTILVGQMDDTREYLSTGAGYKTSLDVAWTYLEKDRASMEGILMHSYAVPRESWSIGIRYKHILALAEWDTEALIFAFPADPKDPVVVTSEDDRLRLITMPASFP